MSNIETPPVKNSPITLLIWAIKIHYSLLPLTTIVKLITDILHELRSLAWPFIYAIILDGFIKIAQADSAGRIEIIRNMFLVYIIYNVLTITNKNINRYVRGKIRVRMRYAPKTLLYAKLKQLGVQYQEDPKALNIINRYKENQWVFRDLLESIGIMFGFAIALVGALIIIINYKPILIPIIILLEIPKLLIDRHFIKEAYQIDVRRTEQARMAEGSAGYITSGGAFKEVLQIGSFGFLRNKYETFVKEISNEINKMRIKWHWSSWAATLLELAYLVIGLFIVIQDIGDGVIEIAYATFVFATMGNLGNNINNIFSMFTDVSEQLYKLKDAKTVLDTKEGERDGKLNLNINTAPLIQYKDITFSYPRSDKKVLSNFNLTIQPGEKIAIIGHNGAGKTTLIKLLTRLYRPIKGEVQINGIDLNSLKIESWYKNVGVLFQDFNTYEHLTVRENVAVGDISKPIDDENIWQALKNADAEEFVKEYPDGLDTILSEKYDGGIRPSTGQWQKIAIARFFYRDSSVLILDEPTASIDAVAEANIFDRIYKFIQNKTVIIISHRFSTVRNADRIIVFEHGKVIEEGAHEELLALNGAYAKAFNLQAKGYSAGSSD